MDFCNRLPSAFGKSALNHARTHFKSICPMELTSITMYSPNQLDPWVKLGVYEKWVGDISPHPSPINNEWGMPSPHTSTISAKADFCHMDKASLWLPAWPATWKAQKVNGSPREPYWSCALKVVSLSPKLILPVETTGDGYFPALWNCRHGKKRFISVYLK